MRRIVAMPDAAFLQSVQNHNDFGANELTKPNQSLLRSAPVP
jgi:hypothetical protein